MENGENPHKILYVDDEPQNLYLFRSLFEQDYEVLTAASGAEALEVLAGETIQVLLADQRMPGINGIQLLERVAREYPHTVRVLVTGYSDIDVVIDAINRGAVYRYLSKPWDIEEIKSTIRNALEVYELKARNQSLITSLHRKIEELNFLNSLQIDLNELSEREEILDKAMSSLGEELRAEGIWHCQQHDDADEKLAGLLADRDLRQVSDPLACRSPCGRSLFVLPLVFQQTSFGHLVFLFPPGQSFDPADLAFAEAASHVVSSVLYSQHLHRQELEKEKFFVLGQMASMIVHDLKGPLATILGFVSLLQAEAAKPQREEFAGIIDKEVRRLIDMVEELLAFSKGQSHLEITTVELPELFAEIMELFDISLKRENIQAEVCLNGTSAVRGDRKKLKKVFINLLTNAREFLQQTAGPRSMRIITSAEEDGAVIRVINNGPAIPRELLPRLFDPFFSYQKSGGTGLGLTICKKIIEEHAGSIQVFSQAGRNEFRITLPAGSPPDPDPKNHSPAP